MISGNTVHNSNVSANMTKSHFYVCPICGNIIHSMGNAQTRFKISGVKRILFYCNRDGLFYIDPVKGIDDKESGYDNTQERRELERAAKMLFG